MAVFSAVFGISGDATQKTSALAASTSSAEIVLGSNAIFAVYATGTGTADWHIAAGQSGMAAASAANFRFPGKQVFTLQTGDHTDRIRIFNPDGANTIDVYVQRLDRF